ncbi:MAG: 23S rRNA (guanosine2251-2'-O)-methyltransferase, partial [Arcticibacterium sp.]
LEKCDMTCKIPMMGKIASLNVSVACGVLLYEANRQKMTEV